MRASGDIPNLINGISQQASPMRLPTQAEAQTNYYSTIVDGLKKRPPTEHVAKILDTLPEGAFFHIIHRDAEEKYVLVVLDGDLRVFDFDGVEKTVTFPDGKGYLGSLDPQGDFRALTVADYTFLTNRDVIVYMDETVKEPTRHHEAVINIMSGNYARTYEITINGTVAASHSTPDGSSASQAAGVATTVIAAELYNKLIANGYNNAPWAVGIHQNALHIVNTASDFAISMVDGVNGNATRVAKDHVQKFSDLPNYGPHGFVIEVGNSEGTSLDNYWVKADKGGTNNNSVVVWRECPKPGAVLSIDAATMPHILVRNADGTFTFKQATWNDRKCGDGDTISPDPSFVGSTIEDITFHRNRLGFIADESVILSRSGSFFDFFRTTATTLLDDDPIDVASTHVKVSFLHHTIPHQDYLLLFSDETQFRLAGNDLLTAKTVSIRPLTEYSASPVVKPIANGPAVFFVSDDPSNDDHAQVYEYTLDKSAETANADSTTAHVPNYIPAGAYRLVGSSDENLICLLTRGRPGSIFIYRYYWVAEEKVQSSWSEWTLEGGAILEGAMIGSELFLLVARGGKAYLEKIRMDPASEDAGMGLLVNLDQRIDTDELQAPAYNSDTDTTTYTLPYAASQKTVAVNRPGSSGVVGSEERVYVVSGNTVTLRGNTTGRKLLFGYPYESRYRFSPFYQRKPSASGGSTAMVDGRLQVHHLSVTYSRSAYFRVEVQTENRPLQKYEMNSVTIGAPTSVIGSTVLSGGRFSSPIMSRNDRVTIDIVNDTWLPSNILSASWRGIWNQKARQV